MVVGRRRDLPAADKGCIPVCHGGPDAHPSAVWLLAGPDGVGKTTYAFRHIRAVSGSARFVNLDEIARGLSPMDQDAGRMEAARVALHRIDSFLNASDGPDFTIETTLAGLTYLRRLDEARNRGWRVHLLYFAVADATISLGRIARRVSEGGHDVPESDARRRFERSLLNLPRFLALADLWRVFDNTGPQPRTAAGGRRGCIGFAGSFEGLPPRLSGLLDELPACA